MFPSLVESMKNDWWRTANLISTARLLLTIVPVWLLIHAKGDPVYYWWAVGVFVVIVLTDALDGYIARRFNQVTAWGAFLDPLVDKVLVFSILLILVFIVEPWIIIPVVSLMIAREVIVTYQLQKRNKIVPAIKSGKWKMASQAVMIVILVIPFQLTGVWLFVVLAAVLVAVGMTIWSWVDSYQKFIR